MGDEVERDCEVAEEKYPTLLFVTMRGDVCVLRSAFGWACTFGGLFNYLCQLVTRSCVKRRRSPSSLGFLITRW